MEKQTGNTKTVNGFEYKETDSHNHIKSNRQNGVYMVSHTDSKVCLSMTHRNKQIQVTLEFPEQSDTKAEQEFVSRLKTIYLEKMKIGAMQKENLALSSTTTKEKEGENHE